MGKIGEREDVGVLELITRLMQNLPMNKLTLSEQDNRVPATVVVGANAFELFGAAIADVRPSLSARGVAVSSVVASAVWEALRAISVVAAPCSSIAAPIEVAIRLTSSIVSVMPPMASTASRVALWICVILSR